MASGICNHPRAVWAFFFYTDLTVRWPLGAFVTAAQLANYSAWASLIGLAVSIFSLAYLRSIKTNIVRFRRQQRIRNLIADMTRIPGDTSPVSDGARAQLASVKRNIPVPRWARFTSRGRVIIDLRACIESGDMAGVKEALSDWLSFEVVL